jgi:hypothetical protein
LFDAARKEREDQAYVEQLIHFLKVSAEEQTKDGKQKRDYVGGADLRREAD